MKGLFSLAFFATSGTRQNFINSLNIGFGGTDIPVCEFPNIASNLTDKNVCATKKRFLSCSLLAFLLIYAVMHPNTAFGQPSAADLRAAKPKIDTTGWTIKGNFGINFTSIGLSNWSGGGNNATSILGLLNFTANYHAQNFACDNAVELGYGLTWVSPETSARKSDDRIILISKAGLAATENLNWTGLVDFRTQFTLGEDYTKPPGSEMRKLSTIFAPAFLTLALGAEWEPAKYMSVLVAPTTGRIVIVGDPDLSLRGSFGVAPGKSVLAELGALVNVQLKRDIWENVNLATRLNIFAPYLNFVAPIVNWENIIILKVNKFLNVSLAGDLIYGVPVTNSTNLLQLRGVAAIGFVLPF